MVGLDPRLEQIPPSVRGEVKAKDARKVALTYTTFCL